MSAEYTPVLACVIPAFDSLLSAWSQMRANSAKQHLWKIIDAGLSKMTLQYNDCRFSKTAIISIGV